VQNQDRFLAPSAAIFLPGKLLQPTLRITIVSGDGPAECGQLLCGKGFYLGRTQFKSEPGLRDWSTFEQNALGVTEHTPRDSTRTLRGTLRIETQDFDRVFTLLESQQKKLALFDFNNADTGQYTFDAHRIYGKLDSFTGPILFGETDINLTIKGTE
jgi:hypothetical protein